MAVRDWKYAVDESVAQNHGECYPYIESPEGERLWLADLDSRQRALAERLVEAANLGCRPARKARVAKLSPEDRRKIAIKASQAAKARTAKAAERQKRAK